MTPLLGHNDVFAYLVQAESTGQLAHGILLVGPRQVGKRHLAGLIAQRWLCLAGAAGPSLFGGASTSTEKPCGTCVSCSALKKGLHPDLIRLQKGEDEHAISVEDMRQTIHSLQQSPAMGARKVAVLEGVETLTTAAANAFLKTLEEPSPNTLILLIADEHNRLLPTIKSRCQVFELQRIRQPEASLASDPAWQAADGLPGLYFSYKADPQALRDQQEEDALFFEWLALTPGQRIARLESLFGKKIPHAQQKQQWQHRLSRWQQALRHRLYQQLGVESVAPQASEISWSPRQYQVLIDALEAIKGGMAHNLNIRAHVEHFLLLLPTQS